MKRMEIDTIGTKAKLSADVWRSLAESERPGPYPADVRVVVVEDGGASVALMTWHQYSALLARLRELERGNTPLRERVRSLGDRAESQRSSLRSSTAETQLVQPKG